MSVEIVSSAGNELAAAQRKEFRTAFLSVAPAMFLGSLDQTIIAAALPVVARAFGEFSYVTWIVTGYLSTATIVAPIYSLTRRLIGLTPTAMK
jgi:MFS family permease